MIIALLLLSTLPHEPPRVLQEQVAALEVNAYHTGPDAELVFVQDIFYDDSGNVLAWRMEKDVLWSYHPHAIYWHEEGRLRVVRPGVVKRTWTVGEDPEVQAREWLPPENRRGLRK